MSTSYESLPATQAGSAVCELEAPVIRASLSQDGEPNLDSLPSRGSRALLSMEDVDFIDTPCMGRLLAAHEQFRKAGGRLVLHSVRLRARETLEFLRLDHVFHIAKDEAAAFELL